MDPKAACHAWSGEAHLRAPEASAAARTPGAGLDGEAVVPCIWQLNGESLMSCSILSQPASNQCQTCMSSEGGYYMSKVLAIELLGRQTKS